MFVKTFRQINRHSVKEAGGKGASLGEMTKAGIPVPPGFVVLSQAFDRFLSETELDADIEAILKKVNHQDINSVDRASNEIRALILEESMPRDLQEEILQAYYGLFSKAHGSTSPGLRPPSPGLGRGWGRGRKSVGLVAVRSSATAEDSKVASWAGELETYLNVTQKNLIHYVMKCWSSLFTPRAIFYAFEKKFYSPTSPSPSSGRRGGRGLPISVAVVVQEMIQAEVSGICFTVHPVTKDRNQMVIEAGFGLGESIVGGLITPDTYVVHKNNFSILDINISEQKFKIIRSHRGTVNKKLSKREGSKQKLTGKQIIELAKLCKKIEQHYRHPQDIEWALARGKFHILQSRPITTL